ncbi:hypothetical protein NMG60_11035304 [Bertholletia excelsa]
MEPNKEEALRAKENAEKRFALKDFAGARNCALKAQMLFPELEGISQMVATFEVYIASEIRVNGEIDFYSILGLEPSAERAKLKRQYKKMAVLLHPDKNKTVGADGAFKLVSEAWTVLSDKKKRSSYDSRRNTQVYSGVYQTNSSSFHSSGITALNNCLNSSVSHGLDTFWTVCTSCQVQYEYLRKYLNKRLSCKNCRGIFIAVEIKTAPVNSSFPYCHWSYMPDNGYGSHGYNGVTYGKTTATYYTGNGVSGFQSAHGSEYGTNVSSQWSSENHTRVRSNGKHHTDNTAADTCSKVLTGSNEHTITKAKRPYKRRNLGGGSAISNGNEDLNSKATSEMKMVDGNGNSQHCFKLAVPSDLPSRRYSVAPAFDARKLLIDKARTEIRKKLEELKVASAAAAASCQKNAMESNGIGKPGETSNRVCQPELKKTVSMPIIVPDSDFHDFDKDRSEQCFKPKQIWALYDEEDGMPRLYCLIREVISVQPFKIHISYLNSKTDSEFGFVNWLDSGFTKSCGNFRAYNSDVVDQVNIFSHVLSREKAGRGGCIRIYPRRGSVWAVYQNWSPDWNRTTPDEVRHKYEMVEILDDYSEELGLCVTPLVKLDQFKTVYRRNKSKDAIQWIPRREMLRFSHQVPSWPIKGEGTNLPDGCWDLDPAAIPIELLSASTRVKTEDEPCQAEN